MVVYFYQRTLIYKTWSISVGWRRWFDRTTIAHPSGIIIPERDGYSGKEYDKRRSVPHVPFHFLCYINPTPMLTLLISNHDILFYNIPVEAELSYAIGMLEYITARLTCKDKYTQATRKRWGGGQDKESHEKEERAISTGLFLDLHCGHNNQYSVEEREKLTALIRRLRGDSVWPRCIILNSGL